MPHHPLIDELATAIATNRLDDARALLTRALDDEHWTPEDTAAAQLMATQLYARVMTAVNEEETALMRDAIAALRALEAKS